MVRKRWSTLYLLGRTERDFMAPIKKGRNQTELEETNWAPVYRGHLVVMQLLRATEVQRNET